MFKRIFFVFSSLFFLFLADSALAATASYDFSGTGHYAGHRSGNPANPNDGLTQAAAGDYTNINSDNAAYWVTSLAGADATYDSQVYRFYINKKESYITQITPLWNGHSDETRANYDLSLLIWNYGSSAWETVQSDSDGSTSDINLTSNITTNVGNYIDTDNEIALWARFENYASGACPTIYSVNEGKEIMEEETILGLINKRMEKYHYEDLEYAKPSDGKIELVIKEERPEITYLNDVKLIAVNSDAKQVLVSPDGKPQIIKDLKPVTSCISKQGLDCLKQVVAQDSKPEITHHVDKGGSVNFKQDWRQTAWTTPDVKNLNLADDNNLRDWVEVELPPAPAGSKMAKLVIGGSETGILSFAEYDWVTTSKENVELFFDMSDNTSFGDYWAKQLYKVVPPKIKIQNNEGEWVDYPDKSFDENIFSTYDTLVFPLDLSLIKNNKIRIESMAYTYIYDLVGVDYSDNSYEQKIIPLSKALFNGEDITGKLNNFDDQRSVILQGEENKLFFDVSALDSSKKWSYHVMVGGYYQPSKRIPDEKKSFWKTALGSIKEIGFFSFLKQNIKESYDLIMTSSNFDYANRRILTKYLDKLKTEKMDPDGTFLRSPLNSNSLYTDYVKVTVTYAVSLSISDGAVSFGKVKANEVATSSADTQVITVNSGPADLDAKTSLFSNGVSSWSLGASNGANQVKWEFSPNDSAWTTFSAANTYYALATNIAQDATQNLYLKITMPTSSTFFDQANSTVTILASEP
jgi:hypothetical protein